MRRNSGQYLHKKGRLDRCSFVISINSKAIVVKEIVPFFFPRTVAWGISSRSGVARILRIWRFPRIKACPSLLPQAFSTVTWNTVYTILPGEFILWYKCAFSDLLPLESSKPFQNLPNRLPGSIKYQIKYVVYRTQMLDTTLRSSLQGYRPEVNCIWTYISANNSNNDLFILADLRSVGPFFFLLK